MIYRRALSILALLSLVPLVACGEKKEEENKDKDTSQPALKSSAHTPHHAPSGAASDGPAASGSPSSAPTGTSTAGPSASGGGWQSGLPAKPVTAKVGERVWAMAPNASAATAFFGVVEVESVQGNTATTEGLLLADGKLAKDPASKHPGTPGALIEAAALPKESKIKKGEIVIAWIPGFRTTAAHVVKLKDDAAEIKYAHDDKVKDATVTYAVPLATGIAPFAYVAAKKGSGWEEILVAGVAGDEVYGVDEAGGAVKVPKADVKALDVQWKDRKKGDKVTVLEGGAATETTIDTVSTEKWIYKVKINGAEKRVPFYAVFDKI